MSAMRDYQELLGRARALVPTLRARAERAEQLGRLDPETERDLHEAGLFRLLQPARIGGAELDYVALIDFPAEIARGDASVAWSLANLLSHHWMLAMFPAPAQARVWGENPDALIASAFIFPCGRARAVAGGYRLSGRWPFSSGVRSSQWNMLGGIVESGELRVFLVPASDYRILDTWDAMGLRGTGSDDVEADDVFVPGAMTVAVAELAGGVAPGAAVNPHPLYQLPVFALFAFVLSGCALGNAEACLEDFETSARQRASHYSRAKIADLQSIQIRIAAASARIDAARRIMRGRCQEAMADARAGDIPDMARRVAYRRDGAFAVNLCTEAVNLLFKASGAGGLARAGAIQRQFREAQAIDSHIAFSFDAAGANYGRVALGLTSENPTL